MRHFSSVPGQAARMVCARLLGRLLALLASASLLAACSLPPTPETAMEPLPPLALQQDNPQLALLEHVLSGFYQDTQASPHTACASVHDGRSEAALSAQDETALMERFETLAPLSRCTLQDGGWIDDENGEVASVINLHSFTCAAPDSCTGWAAAQKGSAGGMSLRYTMDWNGQRWRFASDPRLIADP